MWQNRSQLGVCTSPRDTAKASTEKIVRKGNPAVRRLDFAIKWLAYLLEHVKSSSRLLNCWKSIQGNSLKLFWPYLSQSEAEVVLICQGSMKHELYGIEKSSILHYNVICCILWNKQGGIATFCSLTWRFLGNKLMFVHWLVVREFSSKLRLGIVSFCQWTGI